MATAASFVDNEIRFSEGPGLACAWCAPARLENSLPKPKPKPRPGPSPSPSPNPNPNQVDALDPDKCRGRRTGDCFARE